MIKKLDFTDSSLYTCYIYGSNGKEIRKIVLGILSVNRGNCMYKHCSYLLVVFELIQIQIFMFNLWHVISIAALNRPCIIIMTFYCNLILIQVIK